MIKNYLKNKLYKYFVAIISIFFLFLVSFVLMKDGKDIPSYSPMIETNKLQIFGLEMLYIIDDKTFVNLYSEKAYADKISMDVDLINLKLSYNSDENSITAYADKGIYEQQKILKASGNVKGVMENLDFYTKEDGLLTYNYDTGIGSVENGITLIQGENELSSDKAEFNINHNYIMFTDNVTFDYIPEDKNDIIIRN